ncbi:MAG: cytochrome P450 [Nitrososphaeraceae archaeon]|nr:cytochrome P450 [Nitrososphaeraceae archaeon]
MTNSKKQQLPPGPQLSISDFKEKVNENPFNFLMDLIEKYGDVIYMKLQQDDVYILSNPDHIEQILTRDYKLFSKTRTTELRPFLGNGLLLNEGDSHRHHRKIIQPLFLPKSIKSYGNIMVDNITHISENWQENATIDVLQEMTMLTMGVMAESLFGINFRDRDTFSKISDAFANILETLNRLIHEPVENVLVDLESGSTTTLTNQVLYDNKKPNTFQDSIDYLNQKIYALMDHIKKTNPDKPNLISHLMQAKDPETGGVGLPEKQIRDETMIFLFAAHDTTSTALTWSLAYLATNQNIQDKLRKELDAVLGETRVPTSDDLPKLEYTEKIFKETLRIRPSVWALSRLTNEEYMVGEYVIPSNSVIFMSQYALHNSSKYYSDADKFNPDRWTKEFISKLPRFAYFPFGGGIRSCIGETFAVQEGILALATIFQRWYVMPANKEENISFEPKNLAGFTKPKFPIRVVVKRRKYKSIS